MLSRKIGSDVNFTLGFVFIIEFDDLFYHLNITTEEALVSSTCSSTLLIVVVTRR